MQIAIDSSGRLVVPKALRDALGLAPGIELEAVARDGVLEISPVPTKVRLIEEDGLLVASPCQLMPSLDANTVRAVLENVRR
ncbi:MAG: AbrB/MazE/SpoVT family DNA-binding domain-containing protein [Acidimicrobiales bacterium]